MSYIQHKRKWHFKESTVASSIIPYLTVEFLRGNEEAIFKIIIADYPKASWLLMIPQEHFDEALLAWIASTVNGWTGATPPS